MDFSIGKALLHVQHGQQTKIRHVIIEGPLLPDLQLHGPWQERRETCRHRMACYWEVPMGRLHEVAPPDAQYLLGKFPLGTRDCSSNDLVDLMWATVSFRPVTCSITEEQNTISNSASAKGMRGFVREQPAKYAGTFLASMPGIGTLRLPGHGRPGPVRDSIGAPPGALESEKRAERWIAPRPGSTAGQCRRHRAVPAMRHTAHESDHRWRAALSARDGTDRCA